MTSCQEEDKELSRASDDKEETESLLVNDTSKTDKTESDINIDSESINNSKSNESVNDADINNVQTDDNAVKDNVANPLMPGDESEPVGLIDENGEINWGCPCLQGMGDGPCGKQFKDAFSCFHYSEGEPKGVDCLEQFRAMQECFVKYPDIYGGLDDDLEDEGSLAESATQESSGENVSEEKSTEENENDSDKVANVTEILENTSLPNS